MVRGGREDDDGTDAADRDTIALIWAWLLLIATTSIGGATSERGELGREGGLGMCREESEAALAAEDSWSRVDREEGERDGEKEKYGCD